MPVWVIFLVIGVCFLVVGVNAMCRASKKRDFTEAAYWEENLGEEV